MVYLIWILIGFTSGALPFSVWIGQIARQVDIRAFGDHNPGATNVLRALGWRWAAAALLLDFLKGALPVGYAWFFLGLRGWAAVPVALAPVLGHAFSPLLSGKGGKAVSATFGIWAGLTVGAGPSILGLLLGLMFAVFESSAWASVLALASFGGFILLYYAQFAPEMLAIWLGNLLLFIWKNRLDLTRFPHLRPWLRQETQKA